MKPIISKRKTKDKIQRKPLSKEKAALKIKTEFLPRCAYCEEGTNFEICPTCGNCFCEDHTGQGGNCFNCS